MAGYLCSVCGLTSLQVNACGCLPALLPLRDFAGLSPMEIGRQVLLLVMDCRDHVWGIRVDDLELADHYSIHVIGGLGGRAADPVVLGAVSDARGVIVRALEVKRSAARAEEKRARAALAGEVLAAGSGGGGGGARVLRPVPPDTRPPGGVGVAIEAPAARAAGWDF